MAQLNALGEERGYARGQAIFVQESVAMGVHRVLQGRVHLSADSAEGRTFMVRAAYPGDVLGLMAVFAGHNHETSATATADCRVQFIPRDLFFSFLERQPEAGGCVTRAICSEYLDVLELTRILRLTNLSAGRVARILLGLADESNLRQSFVCTFTHTQLAQMVACSRETVTRSLRDLEQKKMIQVSGQRITLALPRFYQAFRASSGRN
jgi:CRP-like cAMP-binding protein